MIFKICSHNNPIKHFVWTTLLSCVNMFSLVTSIKLVNYTGVAAESSPSQHDPILDPSQVIRAVSIEP